jgi:protein TonB
MVLAASDDMLSTPVPLAQVAVAPVLVHQEIPPYPEDARRKGIEGVVRLEAVLNYEGQIEEEIKVVESIPLLDAVASNALKHWRFTPARDHQGRPVRVILEVPFRFALKEKTGRL